jgi:hypothetical protein
MGVWEQIEFLTGQSLKTLDDQQPFEIMENTPGEVQIYIYSTLETRKIRREKIEGAWLQLTRDGSISATEIKSRYSRSCSPYIASILAAMPGISYRTDPTELFATAERSQLA